MRRTLIAGNWKMNMGRAGAVALAGGVAKRAGEFDGFIDRGEHVGCQELGYRGLGASLDQAGREEVGPAARPLVLAEGTPPRPGVAVQFAEHIGELPLDVGPIDRIEGETFEADARHPFEEQE